MKSADFIEGGFSTNSNGLSNPRIAHVYNRMIPLTEEFARDGRLEKAFRWLGFMQGVLWAEGVYSIEELKRHNKPESSNDESQ